MASTKLLSLLLITLFGLNQRVEAQTKKAQQSLHYTLPHGVSLDWGSQFEAITTSARYESSQIIEFDNAFGLEYVISNQLIFRSRFGVQFQQGRTEYFNEDDKASNSIYLRDAYFDLMPSGTIYSKFGSLSGQNTFSDLLVGQNGMPTGLIGLNLAKTDTFNLRTSLQRSIPTSNTNSFEAAEQEGLPSLDALAISGEVQATPYLLFKARGSYFSFAQIPSQVISESEFLGNRVNSLGTTNAELLYQFQGIDYAINVDWNTTLRLKTELAYQYVANINAPADRGVGYVTGLRESYRFTPNYAMGLSASYYNIDQDATIAYYGGGFLNQTNIQGYRLKLDFEFPENDLRVSTSYYKAQPIYSNSLQEPVSAVSITLEMFNELI